MTNRWCTCLGRWWSPRLRRNWYEFCKIQYICIHNVNWNVNSVEIQFKSKFKCKCRLFFYVYYIILFITYLGYKRDRKKWRLEAKTKKKGRRNKTAHHTRYLSTTSTPKHILSGHDAEQERCASEVVTEFEPYKRASVVVGTVAYISNSVAIILKCYKL